MKSTFSKGDRIKTKERSVKQIKKGKLNEPLIEDGIVLGNEHFDRIVRVRLHTGEEVTTHPDHVEAY